jgi:glycosyltransferase involved in cell wall biosynthesis
MRIIIPSIQVPFISGGSKLMTNGLEQALKRQGYEVEIVTIPFKFFPENQVSDLIDIWYKQNFNNFNGYEIDTAICLQFPAYYTKHNNKILWLMHQHRAVYELYDKKNTSKNLNQLRTKIHQKDTEELSKIKHFYSMSQTVSNRLKKYNNIDSTPLYHPPFGENFFYCDEPYNYIFYPSRLENLKRQDLLIEAMRHTQSPLKAIIAGDGGQTNHYQQLISKYNLNDKVRLIGQITEEEKHVLYAQCLGVFFGPYDEDYGYITLEAMLSSKPVITCTDSGGPLEFVVDQETGSIVEPDPKQIAEKIDWLYGNRQKAKELGQNGLEAYRDKNISWDNVVTTLLGDK